MWYVNGKPVVTITFKTNPYKDISYSSDIVNNNRSLET